MKKALLILIIGLIAPGLVASEDRRKLDVLFVVDSSGSMMTSQENLANNIWQFLKELKVQKHNYRIAVTGPDAFRAKYDNSEECLDFRTGPVRYNYSSDGCQKTGEHTDYPIVTRRTPNAKEVLFTNLMQGIQGYGDERPFQSMLAALKHRNNSGFLRKNAYLSVIILTDEDDFSHDGPNNISLNPEGVNNPDLHSIDSVIKEMDEITGSTRSHRNYNINSMAIFTEKCMKHIEQDSWNGRKYGLRVGEIAERTRGLKRSLCGDFNQSLIDIVQNISK